MLSIERREAGRVISFMAVAENALSPIESSPFPNVTDESAVQFSNAQSLI